MLEKCLLGIEPVSVTIFRNTGEVPAFVVDDDLILPHHFPNDGTMLIREKRDFEVRTSEGASWEDISGLRSGQKYPREFYLSRGRLRGKTKEANMTKINQKWIYSAVCRLRTVARQTFAACRDQSRAGRTKEQPQLASKSTNMTSLVILPGIIIPGSSFAVLVHSYARSEMDMPRRSERK